MVPFNLQAVLSIQKEIAKIVNQAASMRPSDVSQRTVTQENQSFAGQFGGSSKSSDNKEIEKARKRARQAAGNSIADARAVPGMVFNWTKSRDFRGKNLLNVVQQTMENPDSVDPNKFNAVKEALESELEYYQPSTCPRKPILGRVVKAFQDFEDARSGAAMSDGGGGGERTDTTFGGESGSSGDLGGTFGGSPSPDKLASDCLKIVNQLGGINFRFTERGEFLGNTIASSVATVLSSAWTGGPKPSRAQVAPLREALESEAKNYKFGGDAPGLLMALAQCLKKYEESL